MKVVHPQRHWETLEKVNICAKATAPSRQFRPYEATAQWCGESILPSWKGGANKCRLSRKTARGLSEVSAQTECGFEGSQPGVKSNLLHSRCGQEAVLAQRKEKRISASALHSVASPLHHLYEKNKTHALTKQALPLCFGEIWSPRTAAQSASPRLSSLLSCLFLNKYPLPQASESSISFPLQRTPEARSCPAQEEKKKKN